MPVIIGLWRYSVDYHLDSKHIKGIQRKCFSEEILVDVPMDFTIHLDAVFEGWWF